MHRHQYTFISNSTVGLLTIYVASKYIIRQNIFGPHYTYITLFDISGEYVI